MATVLIVDPDPAVVTILQKLLSDRGHGVMSARSGAEALERLEDVDAVVVAATHGPELVRAIGDRSLPVLVIASNRNQRVAVNAMKAGAFGVLTTPFDIDEVALVVERALELRQLRTANRRLVAEQALAAAADDLSLRELVEAFERDLVARALEAAGGNHSEAARRLGTSRATLIDKMRRYGLS